MQERQRLKAEAAEISHGEQTRIAHELHDELGAFLAGLSFRAKALAETLSNQNRPEAGDAGTIVALANQGVAKVRSFSRLLALTKEDAEDLGGSLAHLGAEVESTFGITCMVEVEKCLPKLPRETVHELCRIAQEAVRNAVQHAHAQLIELRAVITETGLRLTVKQRRQSMEARYRSRLGIGLADHEIPIQTHQGTSFHQQRSLGRDPGNLHGASERKKTPPDISRNTG